MRDRGERVIETERDKEKKKSEIDRQRLREERSSEPVTGRQADRNAQT